MNKRILSVLLTLASYSTFANAAPSVSASVSDTKMQIFIADQAAAQAIYEGMNAFAVPGMGFETVSVLIKTNENARCIKKETHSSFVAGESTLLSVEYTCRLTIDR